MKTKIFTLVCSIIFGIAFSQLTPTLFNGSLPETSNVAVYNNEMYFSVPTQGKIIKTSLAAANSPKTDVVTGLTTPMGMAVYGNFLYFVEAAGSLANPSTYSGKLSKIDLTQANPVPVVLLPEVNFPMKIAVNSNYIIINENFLDANNNLTQSITEKIDPTTLQKTVMLTESTMNDDFEFYNGDLIITNYDASSVRKYNFSNSTISNIYTGIAQVFRPTNTAISVNSLFYANGNSPGSVYSLPLNGAAVPVSVVNNFSQGTQGVYFDDLAFDTGGNLILLSETFNSSNSTTSYWLYKIAQTQLSTSDTTSNGAKFFIYPNPTKEKINFSENLYEIKIVALDGKLVQTASSTKEMDLSNLPKGVYLLLAKDKSGKAIQQKIIKE